ncbi:LacI family DNA-binding transcriptional regulator [Litoreibacter albidus]|uniref:LacI family DNA-binding transcriptional regulator n=1 Tax=Litoreibacter albidus TaxID=670155 RepID=UPI0037363003
MKTSTIKDVAKRANVSTATVDRVLHDRAGVSPKARLAVKEAIHELGFGQLNARLSIKPRGRLRFLFLIPELDTGFVRNIIASLRQAQSAVSDVEVLIAIQRVSLIDGDATIQALGMVDPAEFDGVGLFAFDAPGVRDAIRDLVDRGLPVVTLVSDVPSSGRLDFVGVDNIAAGRTAGRLMGKFLRGATGKVGVIIGNQQIRDHMERLIGFRQIVQNDYPALEVLPEVVGDSLAEKNLHLTHALLETHSDLVGLYSIAAGNSGVIEALTHKVRDTFPHVVMHELTADTRAGLRAGKVDAVIVQDTGHMARSAVRLLRAAALKDATNSEQERIRIDVYVAENLI